MVTMRIAALTVLSVLLVRDLLFGSWVRIMVDELGLRLLEPLLGSHGGLFSLGRSLFGPWGME